MMRDLTLALALLAAAAAAAAAAAFALPGFSVEVHDKDAFMALRTDFGCGLSVPDGGGVGGARGLPACNIAAITFAGRERGGGGGEQNVLAGLDGTAACGAATNALAYMCDGAATSAWAADATTPAELIVRTRCGVGRMLLRVALTAAADADELDGGTQLELGVAVDEQPEHVVLLPAGQRTATLLVSGASAFAALRLRVPGQGGAGVCVSHVAVPCCTGCDGEGDGAVPPAGGCCERPYNAGNPSSVSACVPPPKRAPLVCTDDTRNLGPADMLCIDCTLDATQRPPCFTGDVSTCGAASRSGCACAACQGKADEDCAVFGNGDPLGPGTITPSDVGNKRCIVLVGVIYEHVTLADFECVIVNGYSGTAAEGEEYIIDLRNAAQGSCVIATDGEYFGTVGRSTAVSDGDYYYFAASGAISVNTGDGPDFVVGGEPWGVQFALQLNGGDDYLAGFGAAATVDGGDGNDYLELGAGGNGVTVRGGAGNDSIQVDSTLTGIVEGGTGNDCISVEENMATVNGGDGTDKCLVYNPDAECVISTGNSCEDQACPRINTQC